MFEGHSLCTDLALDTLEQRLYERAAGDGSYCRCVIDDPVEAQRVGTAQLDQLVELGVVLEDPRLRRDHPDGHSAAATVGTVVAVDPDVEDLDVLPCSRGIAVLTKLSPAF